MQMYTERVAQDGQTIVYIDESELIKQSPFLEPLQMRQFIAY